MPIECSHTVMETVDSSSFILNDTSISYKSVFVQSSVQAAWLGKLQQQLAQSTKRPTQVMSMLCDIWNFRGIEQVYLSNTQILQIRFSIHWPNHFRWNEPVKLLEAYQMQKFQRRVSKYHGHCQYVHLAAFNLCKLESKLSTCLWHHRATFDSFQSLSLFWFSHACMHVFIYKHMISSTTYNTISMFFSCNLV